MLYSLSEPVAHKSSTLSTSAHQLPAKCSRKLEIYYIIIPQTTLQNFSIYFLKSLFGGKMEQSELRLVLEIFLMLPNPAINSLWSKKQINIFNIQTCRVPVLHFEINMQKLYSNIILLRRLNLLIEYI